MSYRRMSLALVAALSILRPAIAADTIFKRVEADGSVTFTDQPLENAVVTVGAPISVIGPSPTGSPNSSAGSRADVGDVDEFNGEKRPPANPPAARRPAAPIARLSVTPVPESGATVPDGPRADVEADAAPIAASDSAPDTESATASATDADSASGPDLVPDAGPAVEPPSASALPSLVADIEIASPHDGAMLVDTGEFAVLQLDATLTESVSAGRLSTDVLIDGEIVASGPLGSVAFPMPDHGTHVLSAQVVDDDGQVLATSAAQSLHVKKSTSR